ncbi:MAG TPA: cohesin domain-containing protein, partial [Saprospiraceae bacterium]|nr:cohesin domain-containing protein [Saprospiraceae bacterium]
LERRNLVKQPLYIQEELYNSGDLIMIPLQTENAMHLSGIQMTIKFDPQQLEFAGIQGGVLAPGKEHFSQKLVSEGLVSFSWHTANPLTINENESLFNLVFTSKNEGNMADAFKISDDILISEWYDQDLTTVGLTLRSQTEPTFELFQNKPNPWSNSTMISYAIPESGQVHLVIRNVYGQVIWSKMMEAAKGLNSVVLDETDVRSEGVMFIELIFNDRKLTNKMIRLN